MRSSAHAAGPGAVALDPAASAWASETTLVASLVAAAFLVAFGALHYGFFKRSPLMDTPLYERYGDSMVHAHRLPYRDFNVEYPPAALPVFAAPALAAAPGDFSRYARWFEVLMLLCGAAAASVAGFVLVRQRAGPMRLVAGTLLAGLAPLALGPVVLSRYDLWPAALTIGGLAAVITGRRLLAFVLLGIAIAAKVYPAVTIPLMLGYVWRRDGRRAALACAGALVTAVAVCLGPFLALAPHGVWSSFAGQATRPLQIESLGASFLLAAHRVTGLRVDEVSSHGSDNLVGSLPHSLATLQALAAAATLIALWIAFARGAADRDRLLRYSAGAVCAFVALGKVLSPQYLIWLMALVPLVRGRRGAVASALFVATMLLTQAWFPYRYIDLVYGLDARASWLVLARDVLLVALLVTLTWPDGRARKLGIATVGTLTVATVATVATAAAASAKPQAPMHTGLLTESGRASTCNDARNAPAVTAGTVPYATVSFPAAGAKCVTVAITAPPHAQLFSAVYRGTFDPADARARYLGDAGSCTAIPGATGATSRYSVTVPTKRVAVEVESCQATGALPAFTLDVSTGRVGITSASAGAHHLRWRTDGATRVGIYREQAGRRVLVASAPAAKGSYDSESGGLYWLRAIGPTGWAWRGPLSSAAARS